MNRPTMPLFMLAPLILAACVQGPVRRMEDQGSTLHQWIEQELTPYLARQLGEHPRFRDEPLLLVRLEGSVLSPVIDGRTRDLRNRILDGLLSSPGIRLPWQPQQRREEHHRRLRQLRCGKTGDAPYFVGIEIHRTTDSRFRVSIRALDTREREWVSGFGKNWSGRLTAGEQRALQERHRDESLRGLRVLPFHTGQMDLAADYLANNLGCLLRQQDAEDLVIQVEPSREDSTGLHTLLKLIANNLSRYQEVQITDTRKDSNYILRGEAHLIQSGTYQVWVVLHPKDSGEHVAGMDTATYIHLGPPADERPAGRALAERSGHRQPSITSMEVLRRKTPVPGAQDCNGADRFDTAANCPSLEMIVEDAEQLFVFSHSARSGPLRLSPGSCRRHSGPGNDRRSMYTVYLPDNDPAASGWPTIYAIAVNGPESRDAFTRHLLILPDACNETPLTRMDGARLQGWLDTLDRLIASNRNSIDWTARRLP